MGETCGRRGDLEGHGELVYAWRSMATKEVAVGDSSRENISEQEGRVGSYGGRAAHWVADGCVRRQS